MNTTRTLRTHHPIDPLLRRGDSRPTTSLPPPSVPAAPSSAEARLAALAARNGRGTSPTPPAARRGKPARRAKLTALTLSAASTVSLAGMFAHQDDSASAISLAVVTQPATTADATATAATPTTAATTAATSAATTATTTAATTATTTAPVVAGVADGTYVGASDSNRWGTVQVQVVYSGGTLTDVQIIQYPDADNKSVRINQRALPALISESLSAQSADVSTVSGATYTSVSYRASLQSAIDAAKSASGIG